MINNSLHIGKWIYNVLNNNIQDLNIYPVIATEGTECPYCVYWRTGIQASNTKDGWDGDTLTISLNIYTKEYEEGLEKITTARQILSYGGEYENMKIRNFRIIDGSEDFVNGIFIQSIVFSVTITD